MTRYMTISVLFNLKLSVQNNQYVSKQAPLNEMEQSLSPLPLPLPSELIWDNNSVFNNGYYYDDDCHTHISVFPDFSTNC